MNPNLLERDFSYFRSLYPPLGAQILGSVIREVERVSYPESFLFDEYPDAMTLERMSGKILSEVRDELCAAVQEPQPLDNKTTAVEDESPSLALLIKALLFDEIILLRQRRASIL